MKAMKKSMDNKEKSLQSYMLLQLLKPFDLGCKEMQTQLLKINTVMCLCNEAIIIKKQPLTYRNY
jgi:hypothetical protein